VNSDGIWKVLEREKASKSQKENIFSQKYSEKPQNFKKLKQFFNLEYEQITNKICVNVEEKEAPIMIQTDLAMKDFHLKFWELESSMKDAADWINLQMLWRKIQNIDQLLFRKPHKSK